MMKDLVVIGGGHAGCEAALAGARMGLDTLLLTLNMDGIALMACNPVIGGSAKGHLVRELDAMGGEMGRAIDDTFLQSRMLNMSKGPAVHALRAQADKQQYQNRMRTALMTQDNLTVRQGALNFVHASEAAYTQLADDFPAGPYNIRESTCHALFLPSAPVIYGHHVELTQLK